MVGLAGIQILEEPVVDRSIGVRGSKFDEAAMGQNERNNPRLFSTPLFIFSFPFDVSLRHDTFRIAYIYIYIGTYETEFNAFLEFITWAVRDSYFETGWGRNIFSKPGGIFVSTPPLFVLYEILTSRGSIEANFAFVNWILFRAKRHCAFKRRLSWLIEVSNRGQEIELSVRDNDENDALLRFY